MTENESRKSENSADMNQELFMGLVASLCTGAMIHMGKIADPESNQVQKNPELAKASIDLLQALKEKTRGNLSPEEEAFLSSNLSTLQLTFVNDLGSDEGAAESGEKPEETEAGEEQKQPPAADEAKDEKVKFKKTYDE